MKRQPKNDPPTFTLKASEFRALVVPVLGFAENSHSYTPVLACLRFHSSGEHLYATATDRYRLGVSRVRAMQQVEPLEEGTAPVYVPPPALSFLLEAKAVRGLLTLHKAVRRSDPELTFTVHPDRVTVTGGGSMGFLGDSSTHWATRPGSEFPTVATILLETIKRASSAPDKTAAVVGAGFNADYLGDFRSAVTRGSSWATREPVRLWVTSPTRPALIKVGEDFVAALMPVRVAHDDTSAPAGLSEDWTTALTAAEPTTEEPK
jgi:DNA polymerase III sliding clamp (beta) subunit (PCNA family)